MTAFVAHGRHREPHRDARPGPRHVGPLTGLGLAAPGYVHEDLEAGFDPELDCPGHDLVRIVDDGRCLQTDHHLRLVAEHPLRARIEGGDDAVEVGGDDRVLGGRGQDGVGVRPGLARIAFAVLQPAYDALHDRTDHGRDQQPERGPAPVVDVVAGFVSEDERCGEDQAGREGGREHLHPGSVERDPEHRKRDQGPESRRGPTRAVAEHGDQDEKDGSRGVGEDRRSGTDRQRDTDHAEPGGHQQVRPLAVVRRERQHDQPGCRAQGKRGGAGEGAGGGSIRADAVSPHHSLSVRGQARSVLANRVGFIRTRRRHPPN